MTTMSNESVKRAVGILGSQVALAKAIGIKHKQSVNAWIRGDVRVPVRHCPAIERATNGVVTVESLRPDFDWSVIRGSVANE